jgi:hypothetical protein
MNADYPLATAEPKEYVDDKHRASHPDRLSHGDPYLIVHQATHLIDFMIEVFGAEELRRDLHPDGTIMNVEMRLGDSIIELAEASAAWPAMPSGLHVYVPNTDETYQRAIARVRKSCTHQQRCPMVSEAPG